MEAFTELKGLADLSDSFINKTKNHSRRLKEWFNVFQQEVEDIVSDQNISIIISKSNHNSEDEKKLPDIVGFVCEIEKVANTNLRVSSALACLRKDHILHVKRTTPVKHSPRKTRSKSSQQDRPTGNNTFVKFTTPENSIETPVNNISNETSINSLNGEDKQEFYTPVGQNPELSELQTTNGGGASRKRKSSSPLASTANVKKVKALNSETVSVKKSIRKSLRGQHGKLSESKFFKYHNRLPSAKISGSGVNSVLKENRTSRMKPEAEDNQPLKKVLAARQLKAQEAKRKREEKMHKISQQRMKLEKEKDERLRSRKPKEVEKPLIKVVLDPKRKRTQEVEKNNNSEGPIEPHSTKKIKGTESPVKTPRKKATQKLVEKENKKEKTQQHVERICNSQMKSNPHFAPEINQTGTPAKTPRKMGGTTSKEGGNRNDKVDMSKTYNTNSSNTKEISAAGTKAVTPVKEVFKTPVPPQRTIPIVNGSTTANKPSSSPRSTKQEPSLHTTANSQSYEMTPARESFVNYDISEIRSDDSDDDEDCKRNTKPVPGWASGVRLKNALVQQQYRPIDTDLLFGNVFTTPNLEEVMGVKSKRYFKRTSSAVWNSPSSFMY